MYIFKYLEPSILLKKTKSKFKNSFKVFYQINYHSKIEIKNVKIMTILFYLKSKIN